ncbi:MAG: ABC transporter substrate-binding protein, partial [Ktedonobacteraceae bacterium]|nr:ABC transporter substrate-binding protein [Ktedonobacteraceae bacterium]
HPVRLRLLIANSGSGDESVAGDVAQQIVQAASQDKTIVGVMGWPFSESTLHAARILGPARIPLVAQTASTDLLNGTPYFFRINPPDFQQGSANTEYVTKTLHAHRVALFVDNNNAYSKSFADDFQGPFLYARNGNRIVATEQYTVGSTGQARLSSLLQDALRSNPDVIYWAGYASDLSVMLNALPPSGLGAQIPIVGGAGLYELGGYNHSAHARLKQLHFLSYAYPDEWELAGLASQKPFFFQQYSNAFNPSGKIGPGAYGSTRADNDAIVSYDATLTLFTAATSVLDSKGTKSITPEQLQQALTEIDDAHPLQGVSGRIAFGQDGNPINKPLLLLSVDPQGRFHEDALLSGCLQIDHCN